MEPISKANELQTVVKRQTRFLSTIFCREISPDLHIVASQLSETSKYHLNLKSKFAERQMRRRMSQAKHKMTGKLF